MIIIIIIISSVMYFTKDYFNKDNVLKIIENNLKDKDSFLSAFINKQEEMIEKEKINIKEETKLIVEDKNDINISDDISEETKNLFFELKDKTELNTFKLYSEKFIKEKDENKFELYMFNVMNPGTLASEKTQTYLTIKLFKKDNTSENVIRMYELNKGFYIDHHETCLITKENLKEFNKSIENLLKDYLLEINEKENKDKKRKEESMKAIKDLQ